MENKIKRLVKKYQPSVEFQPFCSDLSASIGTENVTQIPIPVDLLGLFMSTMHAHHQLVECCSEIDELHWLPDAEAKNAWDDEDHSNKFQEKLKGALKHKRAFEVLHQAFWSEIQQLGIATAKDAYVFYDDDKLVIAWFEK